MNIISIFHNNKTLSKIIRTQKSLLIDHLSDCKTILDLGCGPDSPIKMFYGTHHTTGVEAYRPYIKLAKKNKTHHLFISQNIFNLKLKNKSYDAVVLSEVLEHIKKEKGKILLKKIEKIAIKKIIITTPNGFLEQASLDKNPLQEHKSGWTTDELANYGYKVYGLAGPKFLRQSVDSHTAYNSILVTIKYKPKILFFILATVLQFFTHKTPTLAFELFAVKKTS